MIKEKLYYNGRRVNELRELRYGGQSMAEITIVVPRKSLSETAEVGEVELSVEDETGKSEITIDVDGVKGTIVNKGVVATKKDEDIYLGQIGSEEYLVACEEHKFNPSQIDLAIAGTIKTHKGYKFKNI